MAARALNLSRNLKELRLHLCQKSPSSQGMRQFIENNYVGIKQENPKFPILIRECSLVEPKIYARYAFGVEKSVQVSNQSAEEILGTIESMSA